jgi:hypothetical protein
MPDTELAAVRLPPTGDRLLTPPLGNAGARIVLVGVFTFRYSGMHFDALYRTGPAGAFSRRHPYLDWSPRAPVLESKDVTRHRYQFRFPAEWKLQGQSIGLRIDLDRFVDEYLIPPSEVRASLTGEMVLRVLPLPAAPVNPWPEIVGASLPAALVIGGLSWILQRRMALAGMPLELQRQLERIIRKQRATLAALGSGPPRYQRLGEDLKTVQAGAWTLARRIRRLRNTRSRIDQTSLVVQVGCLQQELARLTDASARDAGEAALVEKRKALTLLEEIERAEARCTLQLSTLEATLDTTYLTLRQLQPDGPATPSVESVRCELEAEIAAIAEQELAHLKEQWP